MLISILGWSTDDIEMLKTAIWNGTKQLITRSKMEHNPRLLLTLEHQSPNYFIGELDKHIKLVSGLHDEKIRSISDFQLDMSPLKSILDACEITNRRSTFKKTRILN
jgi:CRISPR-associated protein Csh2